MPKVARNITLERALRDLPKTAKRGKWWYQLYASEVEAKYPHTHSIAINVGTGEYLVGERDTLFRRAREKFGVDAKVWIQQVGS